MTIARQFLTLERLTVAVGISGFVGLVGIILLTVIDVVLKYIGADRIPGFDDYGQLFFPVVIAAAFPVGMLHARSVTITFLGAGLGPRADRALNFFGSFLTLVFFVLIAWRFIFMTMDMQSSGAVTPTVLMSIAPHVVGCDSHHVDGGADPGLGHVDPVP